jgi:hypothetical protein
MSNINQSFDLSKTSEDELIISILEADKSIKFTYDTSNYYVTQLEFM